MKYHTVRPEYQNHLKQVGRFFGRLSPSLFRQALNLRNTVTSLDSSQTGSWQDILTAEANGGSFKPAWLTAHQWLLDDWHQSPGPDRDKLEKYLFLGMYFTYLAAWLNQAISDPDTIFDKDYRQLVNSLYEESRSQFEQLPAPSLFWQHYDAIQTSYQEALIWEIDWRFGSKLMFETADWQHYANRIALIKMGITAVVNILDRRETLLAIWEMTDFLNQAIQIGHEILALRRDMGRGHLSYPIMRILAMTGIKVERPFNPEQLIGAAILSGTIKKICSEAAERLAQSRQIAADLSLPSWLVYNSQVEQSLNDIQSLFSLKGNISDAPNLTFLPYSDIMGQSLQMASSFLLDNNSFGENGFHDSGFRESIEVNRGGLEGLEKATGIIFPLSFITYLLLENAHPLANHVDVIFQHMEALGYRYYENMAVAPDTDETAILLRLFKYSQNQEQHHRQLERSLGWLVDNIMSDGRIPAFWDKVDVPVLERMVVWERYCMTAEINTLLGLIEYDWPRFQPLIEKSAVGLFGRYLESDFGTVAYYDLLYSLWQALVLARQLEAKTADPLLKDLIFEGHEKLAQRLTLEAERGNYTPQRAAFLTLACLESNHESLLDPNWITFLQKSQRYDGSWDNEPFYITCDRDGLPGNWYSSRTMTTAFCYHALNRYHQREIQKFNTNTKTPDY